MQQSNIQNGENKSVMHQGVESVDSITHDEQEIQKILQHESGQNCKCGKKNCEFASDFLHGNYDFSSDESVADELECNSFVGENN